MTLGKIGSMMNRILTMIGIASILLLNSCTENTSPIKEEAENPTIDEKAMLMDLYLTDAIKPSLDYYSRICKDFSRIHHKYDYEYSHILNVGFRFGYVANKLILKYDDTTAALIDSLEYSAWDSLNAEYSMQSYYKGLRNHYILFFECCTHMTYVADLYRELPGIEYVSKNWMSRPYSGVYPRANGDTMSYYFEKCVNFTFEYCEYKEYLYIKTSDKGIEFIGFRDSRDQTEKPSWWLEATSHFNDWWYYFYDY